MRDDPIESLAPLPVTAIVAPSRRAWRERVFAPITGERRQQTQHELTGAAALNLDYLLLVVLSCVIATFGLIANSAAVIIGAMLIAPLMTPILAVALALVQGNVRRLGEALGTLFVGVTLAIGVSTFLGHLVSGSEFNFLAELPSEVLSRTQPSLFDLAIAVAGGIAAAYALANPRISATLPGVAISTALMPPVCVVGIGIAVGQPEVRQGALYLFVVNMAAIIFAGSVTFVALGFGAFQKSTRLREAVPIVIAALLLAVVGVPLIGFTVRNIQSANETAALRTIFVQQLANADADDSLVSVSREKKKGVVAFTATVRLAQDLTSAQATALRDDLAAHVGGPVALQLRVIRVTKVDPFASAVPQPTPTRTGTP